VFSAYAVDELEERGGDHLVLEHIALLAAGEEHWGKPILGGLRSGKRAMNGMAHDSLTPSWK